MGSALVRPPHELHRVLDVAPLFRLFSLAFALTGQRFLRRLGDRFKAVLLQHLPRDGMNLNFGNHAALPIFPWEHRQRCPPAERSRQRCCTAARQAMCQTSRNVIQVPRYD